MAKLTPYQKKLLKNLRSTLTLEHGLGKTKGRNTYTGDIEKDLPHFALWVMAGRVTPNDGIQDYLVNKAKVVYQHNRFWGHLISHGSEKERDLLVDYMGHWLDALDKYPYHVVSVESLSADFLAYVRNVQKANGMRFPSWEA